MTPQQWSRIEELFDLVADLPPERQETTLRERCGGDTHLFQEVDRLLRNDRAGEPPIAEAIAGLKRIPPVPESSFVGRKMGAYRIVREVGRGGMGVVFEAVRDDDQYHKRVALKVAVKAAYSPEFLDRFRNERQILAQLEHPNIARLLDGGTTEEGIPFFAMEYVEGVPIDRYAVREKLPLKARLELFLQVCGAVEYAHQNLVIHRDLKPGNILVAEGTARLLDFGIAKLIDETSAGQTQTGFAPATPDYCSPEQVMGLRVTTRSDVYALGLVLYKLLTGERAQQADTSSAVTLQRSICEETVLAPSARAAAAGQKLLARQLKGDLDTIVLAAIQKDAARRYASVAALADDLRRYLDGMPIVARQDNSWYRMRKFAMRHWMPLTGVTLLVATLVGGIVSTSYQARLADRRFQQVRKLAGALTGDVYKAIRGMPSSTKAEETVLRTAVEYLDGLAKEAGNDKGLQLEIANGYAQIARITYSLNRPSLGRIEGARGYFAKAKQILLSLYSANPGDAAVAEPLIMHLLAMGQFLDNTGRQQEGFEHLAQSIAIAEQALERHPKNSKLLRAAATAYNGMMGRFLAMGAARQYLARSVEVAELSVQQTPDSSNALSLLANAHNSAGSMAHVEGEEQKAIEHYRRSLELYRKVLDKQPQQTVARRNLVVMLGTIGSWGMGPMGPLFGGGASRPVPIPEERRREALAAFDEAIAEAEKNHRQDPKDLTLQHDYGVALARKASALPAGDREAIRLLQQGLELLAEAGKGSSFIQRFVLEFHTSLAERWRQVGQYGKAVAEWQASEGLAGKMLAAEPDDPFARRYLIPAYQNWAMEQASHKDAAGAVRTMKKAVVLADELARSSRYVRGPKWPPMVHGWLAELYEQQGDQQSAQAARAESLRLWKMVAARSDLPKDVMALARKTLSDAANAGGQSNR